jgi:hypothetical protein
VTMTEDTKRRKIEKCEKWHDRSLEDSLMLEEACAAFERMLEELQFRFYFPPVFG